MADYKGNTCPVCKQKFKEADDIVVCPDCGTPYHANAGKGRCLRDIRQTTPPGLNGPGQRDFRPAG